MVHLLGAGRLVLLLLALHLALLEALEARVGLAVPGVDELHISILQSLLVSRGVAVEVALDHDGLRDGRLLLLAELLREDALVLLEERLVQAQLQLALRVLLEELVDGLRFRIPRRHRLFRLLLDQVHDVGRQGILHLLVLLALRLVTKLLLLALALDLLRLLVIRKIVTKAIGAALHLVHQRIDALVLLLLCRLLALAHHLRRCRSLHVTHKAL